MTLTRLEKLLLFGVLEIAPISDRWATDCRRALCGWAGGGRLRDKQFRRTCLGAVFRRTAMGQFLWQERGGAAWFLDICAAAPAEVLALASYITPERPKAITLDIAALGLALPGVRVLGSGERNWAAWIADASEAKSIAYATPLSEVERMPIEPKTVVEKPIQKLPARRSAPQDFFGMVA